MSDRPTIPGRPWITRAVVGIVLATFFSDFSHEMATAVLPLYLVSVGLGPAALGVIEGIADFLVSISKLLGGVVGHHVQRKRPWASLGYVVTTLGTAGIGLVGSVSAMTALRSVAWIGRGFRGPLRDHLLAEAVERTHYGRAYGLERAGDMLGAVAGPLVATLLIWLAIDFRTVILWTLLPGLVAASAMFFLTRGAEPNAEHEGEPENLESRPRFPRAFWIFLGGVFLFGMGDFSRTFLIWLAAHGLGEDGVHTGGAISIAVLLYTFHNLVAAASAYPVGRLGDRGSKLRVLVGGYGLGVVTNVVLALFAGSLAWLVGAIVLSGIYISVEETLEKAAAADLLPRELRSLGFGFLACANAVGDMVSSLYVGFFLQRGQSATAFGLASAMGAAGVAWMIGFLLYTRSKAGPSVSR
jgi:MFS family permease